MIFDGNSNVCRTCRCFRITRSQNVYDCEAGKGSRSNLNLQIENPYAALYLMAIVMLALPATTLDNHIRNVSDLCLELQNCPRQNINIVKEKKMRERKREEKQRKREYRLRVERERQTDRQDGRTNTQTYNKTDRHVDR